MHGGACAVLRLAVMEDGGLEDRWFDGWDVVGIMGLIPCVVVDDALMHSLRYTISSAFVRMVATSDDCLTPFQPLAHFAQSKLRTSRDTCERRPTVVSF